MTQWSVTPGQQGVLQTHYARIGPEPVAYLDETYHVEHDGRDRFYVMAAVVVIEKDRDPLRREIDRLVPSGWWHTTKALQTDEGREQARDLLQTFQVPDETCVIVDKIKVDDDDKDGTQARRAVLSRLLVAVHRPEDQIHDPAPLAVVEQQREARANNSDRSVRRELLKSGAIAPTSALVAVSPGAEHLLWLPDLVCSAYRQQRLHRRNDLFDEIQDLTVVIELNADTANPRLP